MLRRQSVFAERQHEEAFAALGYGMTDRVRQEVKHVEAIGFEAFDFTVQNGVVRAGLQLGHVLHQHEVERVAVAVELEAEG